MKTSVEKKKEAFNLKLDRVKVFFFFTGITSFGLDMIGLLHIYSNSIFVLTSIIFFLLGVVSTIYFLLKKNDQGISQDKNILYLYVSVFLALFITPFIHVYYGYFRIAIYFLCLLHIFIGVLTVLFLNSMKNALTSEDSKTLKKAEDLKSQLPSWAYLGIVLGVLSSIFFLIYSPVYGVFVPIICFLLVISMLKHPVCLKNLMMSTVLLAFSTGMFYLYFHNDVFLIHFKGGIQKTGGSFQKQLAVSASRKSRAKIINVSSKFDGTIPEYQSIYVNGNLYGRFIQALQSDYVDYSPYSLLYQLSVGEHKTLVLNSKGGFFVYLTHLFHSTSINALEENEDVLNFIKNYASSYLGGIYHNRETLFYRSSVRPYVSSSNKKYDIIVLPFNIYKSDRSIFRHIDGSSLTYEALKKYLNLLTNNGMLYVQLRTPYDSLSESIVRNFLATVKKVLKYNKDIQEYVSGFKSKGFSNIIIQKRKKTLGDIELYQNLIKEKGFVDFKEDYDYINAIKAIDANDRNVFDRLPYKIHSFSDKDPYYLDREVFQYSYLFATHIEEHLLLLLIAMGGVVFILIFGTIFAYSKVQISHISLLKFCLYLLGMGFITGMIFVVWNEFFKLIFIAEIPPEILVFISASLTSVIGLLLLLKVPSILNRIYICTGVTFAILILYILGLTPLKEFVLSFSLFTRLFLGLMGFSSIFLFLLLLPSNGLKWLKSSFGIQPLISYLFYFVGLALGLPMAWFSVFFMGITNTLYLLTIVMLGFTVSFFYIHKEHKQESLFNLRRLK